ncbi:hypothetical protein C8J57DRAFT_1617979 [Mycena rebaudengoi]|nr:hypothetical protein C8J57DRAFT_1617979 [Mycena rebaudengoi]
MHPSCRPVAVTAVISTAVTLSNRSVTVPSKNISGARRNGSATRRTEPVEPARRARRTALAGQARHCARRSSLLLWHAAPSVWRVFSPFFSRVFSSVDVPSSCQSRVFAIAESSTVAFRVHSRSYAGVPLLSLSLRFIHLSILSHPLRPPHLIHPPLPFLPFPRVGLSLHLPAAARHRALAGFGSEGVGGGGGLPPRLPPTLLLGGLLAPHIFSFPPPAFLHSFQVAHAIARVRRLASAPPPLSARRVSLPPFFASPPSPLPSILAPFLFFSATADVCRPRMSHLTSPMLHCVLSLPFPYLSFLIVRPAPLLSLLTAPFVASPTLLPFPSLPAPLPSFLPQPTRVVARVHHLVSPTLHCVPVPASPSSRLFSPPFPCLFVLHALPMPSCRYVGGRCGSWPHAAIPSRPPFPLPFLPPSSCTTAQGFDTHECTRVRYMYTYKWAVDIARFRQFGVPAGDALALLVVRRDSESRFLRT